MIDIAKRYTKQLERSENKPFVLSRMIAETCHIVLPIKLVRRLYNLYGEYTIYNAVFPTSAWVERKHIKDQNSLFKYLHAVCRNMNGEEMELYEQQKASEERSKATKSVLDEIKEIHARKGSTKG